MHVVTAPPAVRGVTTLQHVGDADGLGAIGADIPATARTVGWAGVAVWAYAKFIGKDKPLAKKALPFAVGGFVAAIVLAPK